MAVGTSFLLSLPDALRRSALPKLAQLTGVSLSSRGFGTHTAASVRTAAQLFINHRDQPLLERLTGKA